MNAGLRQVVAALPPMLGSLAAVVLLGGCVSGQTHEMLRAAHAKTLEENKDLLAENALLRGRLDASNREKAGFDAERARLEEERRRLEAERAGMTGDRTASDIRLRAMQDELARLRAALASAQSDAASAKAAAAGAPSADTVDSYRRRIAELEARLRESLAAAPVLSPPSKSGPLTDRPSVNEAVKRLAAEFGLTYDESTGMLRFPSDMLFPSGDDTLASGHEALRRLAALMNHPEIRTFGIRIVGHTDKRPISQPATARRFPSNWHLAAARAIAVMAELLKYQPTGVGRVELERLKDRFEPMSRGQRDLLDGGESESAHRRNRRVEVYFVPPARLVGRTVAAGSTIPASADAGSTGSASGAAARED